MIWSFYNTGTGVFTGQTFAGPRLRQTCIPSGCEAYEGHVDHSQKRLDLATGELIDFVPPTEDESIVQSRSLSATIAEIESLEKLQIRSMSDLLDNPGDQDARANYDRRKSRIAELRQQFTAGRETIVRAERSPLPRESN